MQSPTALNKRGNKVTIDGYTFDSQKEANFYTKFVKNCGLPFEVHPRFKLTELTPTADGVGKISAIAYSPDFIIKNLDGSWRHVIDIKNSFGVYAGTFSLDGVKGETLNDDDFTPEPGEYVYSAVSRQINGKKVTVGFADNSEALAELTTELFGEETPALEK
ncbi:DUF1064 domain-containing protein [Enterococcus faecalis]